MDIPTRMSALALIYLWTVFDIPRRCFEPSQTGATQKTTAGVRTSLTSIRPFIFYRLQLTATLNPCGALMVFYLILTSIKNEETKNRMARSLWIYRVVILGKSMRDVVVQTKKKVHDHANIALSHCAILCNPILAIKHPGKQWVENLDPNPFSSFIFRYRDYSGFIRVLSFASPFKYIFSPTE